MSKEKTRYEVSADELEARMLKQEEMRNDPARKAVAILEAAVDSVLKQLGVDVSDPDTIADQMNLMGIYMTENTDERMPKANGFYIFLSKAGDIIPYAWVGSARIDHLGRCFADIQYFQDNRLVESGGYKLVQ